MHNGLLRYDGCSGGYNGATMIIDLDSIPNFVPTLVYPFEGAVSFFGSIPGFTEESLSRMTILSFNDEDNKVISETPVERDLPSLSLFPSAAFLAEFHAIEQEEVTGSIMGGELMDRTKDEKVADPFNDDEEGLALA